MQKFIYKTKVTLVVSAFICLFLWSCVGSLKAGQLLFPVTVVKAQIVTATISYNDIPFLHKICNSEVTGSPTKETYQFKSNGDVVRGKVDKSDIGACQINERYNNDLARRLGYDIYTEKGNKDFAVYLYLTQGTAPWNASKSMWSK